MKSNYENRTKTFLPRRAYTIVRLDQKNASNYTKDLVRPFDKGFSDDMNDTAKYLCKNVQGVKLAYTQSDEISLLITDFDKITSDMIYDGAVQKIVSVLAGQATAEFNRLRMKRMFSEFLEDEDRGHGDVLNDILVEFDSFNMGSFDARVFTIPDRIEVYNYFLCRQRDCTRNSISMAVHATPGLNGKNKNGSEMQDMLMEKGINWNDYPVKFKRGSTILKESYDKGGAMRTRWVAVDNPIFSKEKNFLYDVIPTYEEPVIEEIELDGYGPS